MLLALRLPGEALVLMSGPLHGYELAFLFGGGVLVRRTARYPLVVMWLC